MGMHLEPRKEEGQREGAAFAAVFRADVAVVSSRAACRCARGGVGCRHFVLAHIPR
jgi:hypothetical protein